jgi:hypothetical protein
MIPLSHEPEAPDGAVPLRSEAAVSLLDSAASNDPSKSMANTCPLPGIAASRRHLSRRAFAAIEPERRITTSYFGERDLVVEEDSGRTVGELKKAKGTRRESTAVARFWHSP